MSDSERRPQDDDAKSCIDLSPSKESKILDELERKKSIEPSKFNLAPAKLVLSSGASSSRAIKNSRGEITVSLNLASSVAQTEKQAPLNESEGASGSNESVTPTRRKRNRNKAARAKAARAIEGSASTPQAKLNVHPFNKRPHLQGETPPDVAQQLKRKPNATQSAGQTGRSNANTRKEGKAVNPPGASGLQSSGTSNAGSDGVLPNAAPNVSDSELMPPAALPPQSSGASEEPDRQGEQKDEVMIVDEEEETPAIESEQSNGSTDPKRITHQKIKPTGAEGMSYASVANNLCVAIIDQRDRGSMTLLNQNKFDKLSSLLTDVIISQAGKNIKPPVFDDTRLHSGAMKIRCANFQSRQWLEKYIPTLDKKKLWKDASPVVINFGDIPKPHKLKMFVRGTKKKSRDLFALIDMQNPGITTSSWTPLSCEYKNDGAYLVIGVGTESFEMIMKRSKQLYCGMVQAVFTPVEGCKENRAMVHKGSKAEQSSTGTLGGGEVSNEMETDAPPQPPARS